MILCILKGIPKYFSPQLPFLICNLLHISRTHSFGVFFEKKSLDLFQHMFSPASSANKLRLSGIKLIDLSFVLQNIMQSSAKHNIGIGGVFLLI